MIKIFRNNKFIIIGGFILLLLSVATLYITFAETDGCTLADIVDFVEKPSRLSTWYCGEVESLYWGSKTLHNILSLFFTTWAYASYYVFPPVGILMILVGVVRAIRKFLLRHKS